MFVFGDPVPAEVIADRWILIVATYDLLRVRFILAVDRPAGQSDVLSGAAMADLGPMWHDLHFILMSALNGYRLLQSACLPWLPRARR